MRWGLSLNFISLRRELTAREGRVAGVRRLWAADIFLRAGRVVRLAGSAVNELLETTVRAMKWIN